MKTDLPDIFITTTDFERLSNLVTTLKNFNTDELEEELGRAHVIPEEELPFPVVTMNSTIEFRDLDSGLIQTMTLVYPGEADLAKGKVSIIAPIGMALIGLRIDDVISWPVPSGHSRKLKVVSIRR